MNPTKEWGFFLFNFFTIKIVKINIFCAMDIFIWKNLIFYGASNITPSLINDIRNLPNKIFVDENAFTIFTGTEFKNFSFVIPHSTSLQSIIDEDTGVNYTDLYTNTPINMLDAGNISTEYKLYNMSLGIPYYPNEHRHNIKIKI